MIKTIIVALAVLSNLIWLFLAYIYPFFYVYKTGKFSKGVFISWGLNLAGLALISLLVPDFLAFIFPEHIETIYDSFPEARGVVAIFVLGWLPAGIVCGIAYGIHCWKENRKTLKK